MHNEDMDKPSFGREGHVGYEVCDLGGLDVMAQIAATVTPIPVPEGKAPPSLPVLSAAASSADSETVSQAGRNRLVHEIYRSRQLLRQQGQLSAPSVESEATSLIGSIAAPPPAAPPQERKLSADSSLLQESSAIAVSAESLQLSSLSGLDDSRSSVSSVSTKRGRSASTRGAPSNRRVVHNVCERRRRENIRDGFAALELRMGAISAATARFSKMDALVTAFKMIEEGRAKIGKLEQEIAELTARRDALAQTKG